MKILNTRRKSERVFGERVELSIFDIVFYPTASIADVRRRRFDIIDCAGWNALNEIMAQEDKTVFAVHDAVLGHKIAHIW